jgi:hypothetical protein
MVQELADRLVELGQAIEPTVAQSAQQPALDDQYAGFDLGLVPRPAWSRRQDGHVVMGGHLAIAAIDLEIVETRLDHGDTLDNIEGITFGPRLRTGERTLILVSDNNFSAIQFTQFLAFAIRRGALGER